MEKIGIIPNYLQNDPVRIIEKRTCLDKSGKLFSGYLCEYNKDKKNKFYYIHLLDSEEKIVSKIFFAICFDDNNFVARLLEIETKKESRRQGKGELLICWALDFIEHNYKGSLQRIMAEASPGLINKQEFYDKTQTEKDLEIKKLTDIYVKYGFKITNKANWDAKIEYIYGTKRPYLKK